MKVVVCVKQIPDPADPGALDPESNTLKRDTKLILDESDSYGVEMALQLVDTAGDGSVHLVSMAPNNEVGGLRTALAMGADRAIHVVTDEVVHAHPVSVRHQFTACRHPSHHPSLHALTIALTIALTPALTPPPL